MSDQDNDFSWKRDFKNVNWAATLKYNALRAAGAGVVWFLIALLQGTGWHAFPMLLFPIAYFVFLLPVGLIAGLLASRGVPWIGLVSILFALCVVVGDPIVFMVHKFKPGLLPLENPKFMSLKIIIFIINDPEAPVEAEAPMEKGLRSEMFHKN